MEKDRPNFDASSKCTAGSGHSSALPRVVHVQALNTGSAELFLYCL